MNQESGGKYKGPTEGEIRASQEKALHEARAVVEEFRAEGMNVTLESAADAVTVVVVDSQGKERRMGFMKMPNLGKRIEERLQHLNEDSETGG